MPTRILIVGGGGREHALAWKLAAEPGRQPGGGRAGERRDRRSSRGSAACATSIRSMPEAVVGAARSTSAELVVIGPEAPLAAGVADALTDAGVPVFGPTAAAARIETSKAFCHEVAAAAGVRMARGRAFAAGELDAALDVRRRARRDRATGSSSRPTAWRPARASSSATTSAAAEPHLVALLGPGAGAADGAAGAGRGSSSRSGCSAARPASSR